MTTPPPATTFERGLGAIFARWRCAKCRNALGPGPWRIIEKMNFHPACAGQGLMPDLRKNKNEHFVPESNTSTNANSTKTAGFE